MHVLHAIHDDPPDLLERLERTHGRDGVSLNENVAVGEEFDGLRRKQYQCQLFELGRRNPWREESVASRRKEERKGKVELTFSVDPLGPTIL